MLLQGNISALLLGRESDLLAVRESELLPGRESERSADIPSSRITGEIVIPLGIDFDFAVLIPGLSSLALASSYVYSEADPDQSGFSSFGSSRGISCTAFRLFSLFFCYFLCSLCL